MTRLGYFGKLPACGDFVRCCDNPVLVQLLDAWLAQLMHALTAAPRWKLQYDAMAPLRFAFVGRHSRRAIAGRLEASGDQSQRRFPFIVMSELAIADAGAFVPCSPLALAPLWQRMEQLAGAAVAAHGATGWRGGGQQRSGTVVAGAGCSNCAADAGRRQSCGAVR